MWPHPQQSYYYSMALMTLQFAAPLSVLIFTYARIALAVWGGRPPGEAENSRDRRMAKSKRKVKNTHTLSSRFLHSYCIVKQYTIRVHVGSEAIRLD